jgi:hypothetical protein
LTTVFSNPPNDAAICTLDDVKAYLRIPSGDTAYDAEITNLTYVATDMIESFCNRKIAVAAAPIERHDGWVGNTVFLKYAPVVSISYVYEFFGGFLNTLSESTPENPIDGYQIELETGRLIRVFSMGFPRQWYPGSRNIEVSYTVGMSPTPPALWQAARELSAHLFQQQQASPSGIPKWTGGADPSDGVVTQPGIYAGMPYKVVDKIQRYRRYVIG